MAEAHRGDSQEEIGQMKCHSVPLKNINLIFIIILVNSSVGL